MAEVMARHSPAAGNSHHVLHAAIHFRQIPGAASGEAVRPARQNASGRLQLHSPLLNETAPPRMRGADSIYWSLRFLLRYSSSSFLSFSGISRLTGMTGASAMARTKAATNSPSSLRRLSLSSAAVS